MAEPVALDAPIAAVTVYPSQARVIRRGAVSLPAGVHDVELDGLPVSLLDESVRVSGRGDAARIVGVEVAHRFHADAPDERVRSVEDALEELRRADQVLCDDDAATAARVELSTELARRGGRTFASALATGEADGARLQSFADTLAAQLADALARRREVRDRRRELAREIAAREAELESLRAQRGTERRTVVVSVEADSATTAELEVAYLVTSASWRPVYDARLDGTTVRVEWHGLVSQRSGEDWPATDLSLSTARPAVRATVPELDPWYLDVWQPAPKMATRMMAGAASDALAAPQAAAPVAELAVRAPAMAAPGATLEQGVTAATYHLARPVGVPSDGSPHKATITTFDLPAVLDHLTVPKLAEEAYLRATVTNSSPHTLLAGRVSVFHGPDFVGTTDIEAVAPGEELELQLGVDDRLRVERELVRRDTSKTVLGGTRKTGVTYEITVESHLPTPTTLTVLDQFPVPRHEDIKIRDQKTSPEPSERTDLQVLTWVIDLPAGETATVTLSFQLEHPRDLPVLGFTD
jgi:uncharacterized protein (TIGR02231 family)